MKIERINTFYRRNLPHFQPIGAIFFVTFRLHNTLPKDVWQELRDQFELARDKILREQTDVTEALDELHRRSFGRFDHALEHRANPDQHHLKDPRLAREVIKQLHRFDGDRYELLAYCVMSNHVHLLIDTKVQLQEEVDTHCWGEIDFTPLHVIMKSIKGASAYFCNQLLGKTGTFWQHESYDRVPRSPEEYARIVRYILLNPVKAGLVDHWEDYPYTYYKYADQLI